MRCMSRADGYDGGGDAAPARNQQLVFASCTSLLLLLCYARPSCASERSCSSRTIGRDSTLQTGFVLRV